MPPLRSFVRSLPFLIVASALACQGEDLIEPSAGTLEITTSTAGAEADADGYTVQVDAEPVQTIGPAGSVRTSNVVGDHTVKLDGVAANCTVAGENPMRVTITVGETIPVSFSVTCTATGSIVITSSTTGSFPDQDGYSLTVDGVDRGAIPSMGRQTLAGIAPGSHLVGLAGVAANCAAPASLDVEVVLGEVASVEFTTNCLTPEIAFISITPPGQYSVLVVNPDGTGVKKFAERLMNPEWSPDGSKIALVSSDTESLWVINASGDGPLKLVQRPAYRSVFTIRWSPDGSRIGFVTDSIGKCDDVKCEQIFQVWIVSPDGSGLRKVVDGAGVSWSPDGRQVAFSKGQIYTASIDGTVVKQVTSQPFGADNPAWSPDGSSIAFVASLDAYATRQEIMLIKPDGTDLVNLTQGRGDDKGPVWSPDGRRIAFETHAERNAQLDVEVGLMNPDGTGRANLTGNPDLDLEPRWSPDGGRIVFTRATYTQVLPNGTDNEIWVMNLDGSGQANISNSPATYDGHAVWAPR